MLPDRIRQSTYASYDQVEKIEYFLGGGHIRYTQISMQLYMSTIAKIRTAQKFHFALFKLQQSVDVNTGAMTTISQVHLRPTSSTLSN